MNRHVTKRNDFRHIGQKLENASSKPINLIVERIWELDKPCRSGRLLTLQTAHAQR